MKKITFFITSFLLFFGFSLTAQTPDNDTCADAVSNSTTLTVGSPGVCSNTLATIDNATDSGFSDVGCDNDGSKDLWYTLTVPASGAVRVETSSSGSIDDTVMSAYTGSDCNNLTLIGCNDDLASGISTFSRLNIFQSQGTLIYIRVWDFDGASTGSFNICATEINLPSNDDCSGAINLPTNLTCSNTLVSNDATNSEDTDATIPAPGCGTYLGGDVWYSIVVPSTGRFSVETSQDDGSVTDTGIAIYSGNCGSLNLVTCDDDGGSSKFSKIELSSQTPTETLYLRVWSWGNEEIGTFNICAVELPSLSTEENELNTNLLVYPNPARDKVNLKINQKISQDIVVNVFDIQGKIVLSSTKKLIGYKTELNISNLRTGMYFLKVSNGQNEVTKKLIVK